MRLGSLPLLAVASFAALFGSVTAQEADAPLVSGTPPEVVFLQTLQAAQINSLNCLISLVNLTYSPVGQCLGLNSLAPLISNPSSNSSFSTQLNTYLTGACGRNCADSDLAAAKQQLASSCSAQQNLGLITALNAIFNNYRTSYKTLVCSVRFNGTAELCLPSTLNSTNETNSHTFFADLVSGTNLQSYTSIFQRADCTGCMYEMFKAAQYTISRIRGNSITNAFGEHLSTCPGDSPKWSDVTDQQIPNSLQVQQSTPGSTSGATRVSTSIQALIISLACAALYT